jgi:hypothetical protein
MGAWRATQIRGRWRQEIRVGESTSGESRLSYDDPDEQDKGDAGFPLTEKEYAARPYATLPPPAPYVAPPDARGRYELRFLGRPLGRSLRRVYPIDWPPDAINEHAERRRFGADSARAITVALDGHADYAEGRRPNPLTWRAARPEALEAIRRRDAKRGQIEDYKRPGGLFAERRETRCEFGAEQEAEDTEIASIMLLRWGPQGEMLNDNGGSRYRLHLGVADDKAFPKDRQYRTLEHELNAVQEPDPRWRHLGLLNDEGAVRADFLRSGGWVVVKAGETGRNPGRPRSGATSGDLIRQRLERSGHPLERYTEIVGLRRRRTDEEQAIYDELAVLVSSGSMNRGAVADVLGCARRTVDRLARHGLDVCGDRAVALVAEVP